MAQETDTSANGAFGRRTWDRDEYARRAQERHAKAQAGHGTGHGTAADTARLSKHELHREREAQLHRVDEMNTVSFVSEQQTAQTGRRGRGIGFYCDVCDLTYKNDLELVDHLNSKQHFQNAGVEYVDNREITLEMVVDRVERLAAERTAKVVEQAQGTRFDLAARLEARRAFDASIADRRRMRKAGRRAKAAAKAAAVPAADSGLAQAMGFGGFGSSKRV